MKRPPHKLPPSDIRSGGTPYRGWEKPVPLKPKTTPKGDR